MNQHIKGFDIKSETFKEAWCKVLEEVNTTANLSEIEQHKLNNNICAKLIVFCSLQHNKNPLRWALTNLTIFIAATRSILYHQKRDENIQERLAVINFPIDSLLSKGGKLLLELASLRDHLADKEQDRIIGKFNPLENLNYNIEEMKILFQYFLLPKSIKEQLKAFYEKIIKGSWWWA